MTYRQTLSALNAYPMPPQLLESIGVARGLDLDQQVTTSGLQARNYRLATADIYRYLADAPNISQGGQSYSFSEDQRRAFRGLADDIEADISSIHYGYKGHRL